MEENDAQLHLKKRARRRLVGAIAFVSVVAVVLPMVMDHEPRQVVQEVDIRIPGQDEKPFAPKFSAAPLDKTVDKPVDMPAIRPSPEQAEGKSLSDQEAKGKGALPTARVLEVKDKSTEKVPEKAGEKALAKAEKLPEKTPEKAVGKPEKPVEKSAEKPATKNDDAKRAASILAGQAADAKSDEYLVLIGAFSNEANVKNLKAKLGEQGIKTFSEPLETPQGKKTRVRAGPFPSREAAEKALQKMQKMGVSGVVTARQ